MQRSLEVVEEYESIWSDSLFFYYTRVLEGNFAVCTPAARSGIYLLFMGETAQILALWRRAAARGERVCLATVVHVEGSSYRKPGARMLVTSGGQRAGTISGGCLEAEVSRKCWWLTAQGPAVEQYQSSFDEDGGGVPWGLGCGGTVWVLLEQNPESVLEALERALVRGEASVVISQLTPPAGTTLTSGEARLREVGAEVAARHRSMAVDERMAETRELPAYYVEYLAPPPHLSIFGAGDDAQPIASFADALGWRVTVADGRSHLLRAERFPAGVELRLLQYDTAEQTSPVVCGLNDEGPALAIPFSGGRTVDTGVPREGFAVLLTHSYEQDRALLASLLPEPLRYLGILGPRHRTMRLLAEIAPELGWTTEQCLARLHSPVGLDLGAADPAAIALSIVADLQATLAGRSVEVRRNSGREQALPARIA